MNQIPTRQNDPKEIRRLAAARNCIRLQNKFLLLRFFLSCARSNRLGNCRALLPSMKSFVPFTAYLFRLLICSGWLLGKKGFVSEQPKFKRLLTAMFLELPWNDFKIGAKPDHELVKEYADIYGKKDHSLEPLLNGILPP